MLQACKWVRRSRAALSSSSVNESEFVPMYAADVEFAGDSINGYVIHEGIYMNLGGDMHKASICEVKIHSCPCIYIYTYTHSTVRY